MPTLVGQFAEWSFRNGKHPLPQPTKQEGLNATRILPRLQLDRIFILTFPFYRITYRFCARAGGSSPFIAPARKEIAYGVLMFGRI